MSSKKRDRRACRRLKTARRWAKTEKAPKRGERFGAQEDAIDTDATDRRPKRRGRRGS